MTRSTQAALIAGGLLCAALFVAAWRFGGVLAPLAGTQTTWEGAAAREPFPRTARDIHGVELTLDGPPPSLASQALVTDHYLFADRCRRSRSHDDDSEPAAADRLA